MREINFTKVYGILGKSLCGCAGAIIGFLTKGIGLALIGGVIGITSSHHLEKAVAKPPATTE